MIEQIEIHPLVVDVQRTGSAYTCNPPVTDTDKDFLVLIGEGSMFTFSDYLEDNGWVYGGSSISALASDTASFNSFRRGSINLIVVANPKYYARLRIATLMAKKFNLTKKEDRVLLFEVIADQTEPMVIGEELLV